MIQKKYTGKDVRDKYGLNKSVVYKWSRLRR